MNTLPFRLSFPFESVADLPRLKIDFHLFDFPDNFLLQWFKPDNISVFDLACVDSGWIDHTLLMYSTKNTD